MGTITANMHDQHPEHDQRLETDPVELMRGRLLERMAKSLADDGISQIALFGAGRHTRPILRQPWQSYGIRVAMILDDAPGSASMGNVPIVRADEAALPQAVGAIVISSQHYEAQLFERASELFGETGVPIHRLYTRPHAGYGPKETIARLTQSAEISHADAVWLAENRGERHDATLDMLPPDRTELHLRRYELARDVLQTLGGTAVADMACGTGYGAVMLADTPATQYTGIEIDARTVEYAARRFGTTNRTFLCASVTDTPLQDGQADFIASFETIEHIEDTDRLCNEYARVLSSSGVLVLSTPNKLGPTPFHVHDFDYATLTETLGTHFEVQDLIGQLPNDTVYDAALPPGMWRIDPNTADNDCVGPDGRRPDYLIVIARHRGAITRRSIGLADHDTLAVQTKHGLIHLFCPNPTVRWRAQTLLSKEPETIDWIDSFEPGDVYWDIGASTGPYVMYAAASGVPSKIFAFEPSPWNWWVLAEQIRRAGVGSCVHALPIAVGEKSTVGTLHMRHPMPGGAGSSFGSPRGEFGEVFTPSFEQSALSITIDDLITRFGIERPNRIKIDVDGNELAVLRGGRETLANASLRSVLVELDDARQELIDEVSQLMNDAGLHCISKRHAPDVDDTANKSIYNFVFARTGV